MSPADTSDIGYGAIAIVFLLLGIVIGLQAVRMAIKIIKEQRSPGAGEDTGPPPGAPGPPPAP